MCLIVHKPAGTVFHESWLRDFYKKNDDGFGFLYAENGNLHIHKSLGRVDRFVAAFEARKDKECLIHVRMRTHGKYDLDNCHPYEVLTPEQGGVLGAVWMMHNGILGFGNDGDKDKSDTWHYINSFLRPILVKCPMLLLDESFQKLVGREIGSTNKFAFMSGSGDVVVINHASGTMWNDAWMSNTYAWSAGDAKIPGVYSGGTSYHYQGSRSHYDGFEGYDHYDAATDTHNRQTHGHSDYRPGRIFRNGKWVEDDTKPVAALPAPQQGSWPFGKVELSAGDVFKVLDGCKFAEAYGKISVAEMEAAIFNDSPGVLELIGLVEDGTFKPGIDDDFVVKYVRKLSTKAPNEAAAEAAATAAVAGAVGRLTTTSEEVSEAEVSLLDKAIDTAFDAAAASVVADAAAATAAVDSTLTGEQS